VAFGGVPVIILLLEYLLVLSGLTLLVLVYFLVSRSAKVYITTEDTAFSRPVSAETAEGVQARQRLHAIIRCNAIPPVIPQRFRTTGYTDCRSQNLVFGGQTLCEHVCLGLGSCAGSCPNDAIILGNGKIQVTDSCNGCGLCVNTCPRNLIELVPDDSSTVFSCSASGKTDATTFCGTARDGYSVEYHIYSVKGFKILKNWAILNDKTR
jgi:ferredoxin